MARDIADVKKYNKIKEILSDFTKEEFREIVNNANKNIMDLEEDNIKVKESDVSTYKNKFEEGYEFVENLIYLCIAELEENHNGYCVYPNKQIEGTCNATNCNECREEYYEKLANELNNKYDKIKLRRN